MSSSPDKTALRRQARMRRRTLSAADRERAQTRIADHLQGHALRQQWRHVAAYVATASEADLGPWFARLDAGLQLALPAIEDDGGMRFRQWRPGDSLQPGPFSIAQPSPQAEAWPPQRFDAVLLPLLAFDRSGVRLGSGAGYYDRAFAFRRRQSPPPRLIGIAFAAQAFDALPADAWDVRLDAVVTELGWLDCAG